MDFVRFYSWFNWQHPKERDRSRTQIIPVILLDIKYGQYFRYIWSSAISLNCLKFSGVLHHQAPALLVSVGVSVCWQQQADHHQWPHPAHHLHHPGGGVHQHWAGATLSPGSSEDPARSPQPAQQSVGQWCGQHQHQAQMGAAGPQRGEYHQLWAVLEWHLHTFSKCF